MIDRNAALGHHLLKVAKADAVAFKRLHDDNAPLEEVIPEFVAKRRTHYLGRRLRDLCAEMLLHLCGEEVTGSAEP